MVKNPTRKTHCVHCGPCMAEATETIESLPADPKPKPATRPKPKRRNLPPFNVVLLDDNDHTYDYVIEMLGKVFGHNEGLAFKMAQEVDHTGRSIVCTTHREHAELKRDQIHGFGCDIRLSRSKTSMRAIIEPARQ